MAMPSFEEVRELVDDNMQLVADAANEIVMPTPIRELDKTWIWLTLPNCGLATETLRQRFGQLGVESKGVLNEELRGHRFEGHTQLYVGGDERVYVDPTYLQFFSQFGLDIMLVTDSWVTGMGDVLPSMRGLVYTRATWPEVVTQLSEQTLYLLDVWKGSVLWGDRDSRADVDHNPSGEQLIDFFSKIYNPDGYRPFEQKLDKQEVVTDFLDTYTPGYLSLQALLKSCIRVKEEAES